MYREGEKNSKCLKEFEAVKAENKYISTTQE